MALSFFFLRIMTKILDSRKPEPYIKTSCKKCITPIEYLPEGLAVGEKVKVKCWACDQVETYQVTEPNQSPPKQQSSKPKTSRKKGSGR